MIKRFFKDLCKYKKYILYSAQYELRAEVANSYLNWVWWILEPISFMLIYTLVFGYVFKVKEDYFPLFIFLGITIWDFFSKNITNSVKIIKNNKNIVTKVYLPKFILVLSKMFVNLFKLLVSITIIIGLMIFYKINFTFQIFFIIPLFVVLFIFTFSCMIILSHFGVFIADLSNVIKILLRLTFYATGIFYSIENLIGKSNQVIANILLKFNPLALIICSARNILLYHKTIDFVAIFCWLFFSIMLLLLGVKLIYKYENSYIKVI